MIEVDFVGFDWDDGNTEKCQKHGLSTTEVEAAFSTTVSIRPSTKELQPEERFVAVGKSDRGRHVFVVFTLRKRDGMTYLRPISARYMHRKEIASYEEENPDVQ